MRTAASTSMSRTPELARSSRRIPGSAAGTSVAASSGPYRQAGPRVSNTGTTSSTPTVRTCVRCRRGAPLEHRTVRCHDRHHHGPRELALGPAGARAAQVARAPHQTNRGPQLALRPFGCFAVGQAPRERSCSGASARIAAVARIDAPWRRLAPLRSGLSQFGAHESESDISVARSQRAATAHVALPRPHCMREHRATRGSRVPSIVRCKLQKF